MKPAQKALTTLLWIVFVLAMVSVIGAGLWTRGRLRSGGDIAGDLGEPDDGTDTGQQRSQRDPLAPIKEVPAFSLVDQDEKTVTRSTLTGKAWIGAFVFTRCANPTACPMMTKRMALLQKAIPDPAVTFVSFSVDPEFDKPPVLKAYAKSYGADETRWRFLTGEKDAIFTLANGMLISARPANGTNPILHSEKLILVDATGKIRKYYDSNDPADIERLTADATKIAREANPVPAS
jgi:protein SCO1